MYKEQGREKIMIKRPRERRTRRRKGGNVKKKADDDGDNDNGLHKLVLPHRWRRVATHTYVDYQHHSPRRLVL